MSHPVSLAVLINSLSGGGAEGFVSKLVPEIALVRPDWKITLVLMDETPERFQVPDNVETVRLRATGGYWDSFLKLRNFLKERKQDVVLSFLTRSNCLNVLLRNTDGHLPLISERGDPEQRLGRGAAGAVKRLMVRYIYPKAVKVIPVAAALGKLLSQKYAVPTDRIAVIYNPVSEIKCCRDESISTEVPQTDFIAAVGRLIPLKGFDVLIRAFSRSQYTGNLVIFGEGPEEQNLQSLCRHLGIESRVFFPGFVESPASYLRDADAFVLSSHSEGFPNALLEAMAVGCPVLASDCNFGPAEILHGADEAKVRTLFNAKYGFLVPPNDEVELARGIDCLAKLENRAQQSDRVRQRASHFSLERCVSAYVRLVDEVLTVREQGSRKQWA